MKKEKMKQILKTVNEYRGDNQFLLNIQDFYKKNGYLSKKQLENFDDVSTTIAFSRILIGDIIDYDGPNEFLHSIIKFYNEKGYLTPSQFKIGKEIFGKILSMPEND